VQSAVKEWPTIRPHRLAVGFYNLTDDGKLERVHREELDVDGERTEVPALAGWPSRTSSWSTMTTSPTPRCGWTKSRWPLPPRT
jgi:hypothetical protein